MTNVFKMFLCALWMATMPLWGVAVYLHLSQYLSDLSATAIGIAVSLILGFANLIVAVETECWTGGPKP